MGALVPVSILGPLGGADVSDLFDEMFHDHNHLRRWDYIEEPQGINELGIFIGYTTLAYWNTQPTVTPRTSE